MKTSTTRKTKPGKTAFKVIKCENCGQPFQPKREWQKFCKPTCRFTVGNKKRDRVIEAAKILFKNHPNIDVPVELKPLHSAVCDLEGWNKEGDNP